MDDIFGPSTSGGSKGRKEDLLDVSAYEEDAAPAFGDNPFEERPAAAQGTAVGNESKAERAQREVRAGLDDFKPGSDGKDRDTIKDEGLDEWYTEGVNERKASPLDGVGGKFSELVGYCGHQLKRFAHWVRTSTIPAIYHIMCVVLALGSFALCITSIVQFVPTVPKQVSDAALPANPGGVPFADWCSYFATVLPGAAGESVREKMAPLRFIFDEFTYPTWEERTLVCPWTVDIGLPRLFTGLGGAIAGAAGFFASWKNKKWLAWLYVGASGGLALAFFYEMCVDSNAVNLSTINCNAMNGTLQPLGLLGVCHFSPFVAMCLADALGFVLWAGMTFVAQHYVRHVMSRTHGMGVV